MFSRHDAHDTVLLSRQLSFATRLPVSVLAHTDSTNQQLLADGASVPVHPAPPCALLALHQTAGRGRLGRAWHTLLVDDKALSDAPAPAFLASMAIRADIALPLLGLLPLHMGVAVAQQLHQWACPATVKWPNDIEVSGAKLGGILVETRLIDGLPLIVMGLGLNWHAAPQITGRPTCAVAQHAKQLPDPTAGASAMLLAMQRAWDRTVAGERCDFAPYDALHQQRVQTVASAAVSAAPSVTGTAIGINAAGHLGVRTETSVQWLSSGEVSVLRV